MRETWKRSALLATLLAAAAAGGCAQDIGDIDRTDPDKILKSDLTSGTWWMSQKVTHVDSVSSDEYFEGLMSDMDKVRFVAEENYLIAYRAYPDLAGSDDTTKNFYGEDSYEELYGGEYTGTIKAVYPISSHFDVQRTYDTATGEQSNVIVENTSDRNWWERDYMRVDWSSNSIINFEWRLYYGFAPTIMLSYSHNDSMSEDGSDVNAPYFERNKEGIVTYFDTPATYIAQPTIWGCAYGAWFGNWFGSCNATSVRVVTSFVHDLGDRDYESVSYSNQDMGRFGYFRSERKTYDPYVGILNAGDIQLANRHNIWEATHDADGNLIPLSQRKVKTIPYYIRNLDDEQYMEGAAYRVIEDWNETFKKAVRVIQANDLGAVNSEQFVETRYTSADAPNKSLIGRIKSSTVSGTRSLASNSDRVGKFSGGNKGDKDIFVLCHIPVQAVDNVEVCGEVGSSPREGDFRKNVVWLINQRQDVGLLGYGPGASDPLTGETFSGNAHVYTAPMARQANSILDFIKYINGDLTDAGLVANADAIATARETAGKFVDLTKMSSESSAKRLRSSDRRSKFEKEAEMKVKKANLKKFDYTSVNAKMKSIYDSGLVPSTVDSKLQQTLAKKMNVASVSDLSDEAKQLATVYSALSPEQRNFRKVLRNDLGAKGYCFENDAFGFDPNYAAIAREYMGRTDYQDILYELRARVFVATTLHEMGHSFGLRHNFAGSYDSLNYQNRYWELRADDNFKKDIKSYQDMLKLYDYSDKQLGRSGYEDGASDIAQSAGKSDAIKGGMMTNMYSSIMDYTAGATNDFNGLGKYDLAAIIYAYSKGYDLVNEDSAKCAARGGKMVGSKCGREVDGIIEVFEKTKGQLGAFGAVLTTKDTTGAVSGAVKVDSGDGNYISKKVYSTFDDQTTIGQPYLELVHYQNMVRAYPDDAFAGDVPKFVTERKYGRVEDYLASKANGGDDAIVRVPYLFCSDENAGQLASCNRFDFGADALEQMLYYVNEYDNYYWFTDYARGRSYWNSWSAANRHLGTFLDISDRFQNWYAGSKSVLDSVVKQYSDVDLELNENVGYAAVATGFNLIAKALVTPDYGLFCERQDNGHLFGLSANNEAAEETSEFHRGAFCGGMLSDPVYYYVKPGEGRRHNQKYDVDYGYDYQWHDYELEHIYTAFMAAVALFDNEADVMMDSGDVGTYTFGYFDFYKEELTNLVNGLYAESYKGFSPRLDISGGEKITVNGEEYNTGKLIYRPATFARWYGKDDTSVSYDPRTGMTKAQFDAIEAGTTPILGACESESDCMSDPNAYMAYCSAWGESGGKHCTPIYDDSNAIQAVCPSSAAVYKVNSDGSLFACLPNASDFTADAWSKAAAGVTACSASNPVGYCANSNETCDNGSCRKVYPIVDTDTSLTVKVYMTLYGMLYSGPIGMDSSFNDQINIFKMGSGEEVKPGYGYKTVTFTDPFTGAVYGANTLDCDNVADDEELPAACHGDMTYVSESGGAMLINLANENANRMLSAYNELIEADSAMTDADYNDESSPKYKAYMDALYRWYAYRYQTEYNIRDINWLRGIYPYVGGLY